MKTKLILLFPILLLFCSCRQKSNTVTVADKFIEYSNNNQKDSLLKIVSDNFHLKRTFVDFENDRRTFFDEYLPYTKSFNGKYKVLQVIDLGESKQFLVEDQSDYFKYLNIPYPNWKIHIKTKASKVEEVIIDTTENYQAYLIDLAKKDSIFNNWLKATHPDDTPEKLIQVDGLFHDRLKEYSEKKK